MATTQSPSKCHPTRLRCSPQGPVRLDAGPRTPGAQRACAFSEVVVDFLVELSKDGVMRQLGHASPPRGHRTRLQARALMHPGILGPCTSQAQPRN